ncbi:MAG TPA: hypothetical protein VGK99_20545 [Acidobacteriota bacterium]|jgi:hypothetical protein
MQKGIDRRLFLKLGGLSALALWAPDFGAGQSAGSAAENAKFH